MNVHPRLRFVWGEFRLFVATEASPTDQTMGGLG